MATTNRSEALKFVAEKRPLDMEVGSHQSMRLLRPDEINLKPATKVKRARPRSK